MSLDEDAGRAFLEATAQLDAINDYSGSSADEKVAARAAREALQEAWNEEVRRDFGSRTAALQTLVIHLTEVSKTIGSNPLSRIRESVNETIGRAQGILARMSE